MFLLGKPSEDVPKPMIFHMIRGMNIHLPAFLKFTIYQTRILIHNQSPEGMEKT
jgi:hypothetical protein